MAESNTSLSSLSTLLSSPSTAPANGNDAFDMGNLTLPENGTANPSIVNNFVNKSTEDVPFYLKFRDEPWVIPLVAVSLLNIAAIFIFEIYVLYKSCGGRRHLFLGQILLFGLLLCSVLGLVYVPEPHWLFCGITRAGVGIAYTVVFGTLLVKCVFLLKIHNGVYFNASFQALLLFFIVVVEVVIVTQWLVYVPANVTSVPLEAAVMCEESPLERIEYLIYVMFLLFLVIVASIRGRSLKENNKEAVYIGLSIAFCLIFWVAWISVSLIFDRRYDAPAEAFGLVCSALFVFLLIFIPKAAHLANPKSNLANGSTVGSHSVLQTPSFLHLQPHAVLPSSTQGTLMKQSQVNADYCRGYSTRIWRYDYPSFHQMEPPAIANSEMNSMKKSNGSSYNHSHLY